MQEGDKPFVLAAWARCAMAGLPHRRKLEPGLAGYLHRLMGRVLARCEVRVAFRPGDADERPDVLGFAVLEPRKGHPMLVHLVYVAEPHRRQGLARRLLAGVDTRGELYFSTHTQAVTEWIREAVPGLRYRPFWMEE